jgi:tetratricopeptide (TPR) repeat protein
VPFRKRIYSPGELQPTTIGTYRRAPLFRSEHFCRCFVQRLKEGVAQRRAFAMWEKALGPDHPDAATSLSNLALLYEAQGRYAYAEPLYQRALAINEKALGPEHPDVATVLENYARLLREMRRGTAARELEARAQAIRAAHAKRNPPSEA